MVLKIRPDATVEKFMAHRFEHIELGNYQRYPVGVVTATKGKGRGAWWSVKLPNERAPLNISGLQYRALVAHQLQSGAWERGN